MVEPQVGQLPSAAGTPLHRDLAVRSLVSHDRTVYELKPKLWRNRNARVRIERIELESEAHRLSDAGLLGQGAHPIDHLEGKRLNDGEVTPVSNSLDSGRDGRGCRSSAM